MSDPKTTMQANDLAFATIPELARLIRSRRTSPVELATLFLDRLERRGRQLGAVAYVVRESALREARQAESELRAGRDRGVLHGIPYGVKDLLATREAPTTWGARPYKDQRFDFDATVVNRLRAAGAVLVAKLAMIELAGGMNYNQADASLTGACLTPWNTKYWSGGSSSGPGSAVAAGCVPFAIGSETSGSIITPAAFCGVTGFRPTYGVVSRHGAMALSWTLDKLGPMCRSAEDCGIVLRAIAGRDKLDPTSVEFDLDSISFRGGRHGVYAGRDIHVIGAVDELPRTRGRRASVSTTPKPLRIAVMKDSYDKAQPEVRTNFLRSLDVLRRLPSRPVEITMDVALPDFPYGACVGTIVDAEGASAFRDLIESGRVKELASPEGRTGGYAASMVAAVDYLHAMRLRAPMRKAWAEMFAKYDLLVAPSRSTVAYPVDRTFDKAYPGVGGASPIGASNLVGVPAISVPNGFGVEGLPTGIQFVAPAFADARLLELARAYQTIDDAHRRRPSDG